MTIRTATMDDLKQIVAVEAECFPVAEAATEEAFIERLTYFPNHFWLLYHKGVLVGFINGMVTNEHRLRDDMYEKASMHDEMGSWQMIFGVNTIPSYRRQGCAEKIMKQVISDAKEQSRKGLILTCKEQLVHYYAKFGFIDEGISASNHGGAIWHEMRLMI